MCATPEERMETMKAMMPMMKQMMQKMMGEMMGKEKKDPLTMSMGEMAKNDEEIQKMMKGK